MSEAPHLIGCTFRKQNLKTLFHLPVDQASEYLFQKLPNEVTGSYSIRAVSVLLNSLYDVPPQKLIFEKYPSGAPKITFLGKQFNISTSHIRDCAVVVECPDSFCIGIDVVGATRRKSIETLYNRVLTTTEKTWFCEAEFVKSPLAFYKIWALKEASQKAWKVGMQVAPWDIEVSPTPSGSFTIHCVTDSRLPTLTGIVVQIDQWVVGFSYGAENELVRSNKWNPRQLHMGC
jgi:phosphopantetheinyl transferase